MNWFTFRTGRTLAALLLAFSPLALLAQAGSIEGSVADPTGAVIPGATLHLTNTVSGFDRTATSDATGQFTFPNVPFNTYQLTVNAQGFSLLKQTVDVRSAVATNLQLVLHILSASSTVTVEAGASDLVENDPTFHTDVDRDMFIKVPMESQSSSLSSLITETTPGVTADSNGLFHGLGDHASNSFSIDGQSITDQQSKVFSNQLPSNAIESIQAISGAPPAEYGGKTSLVIVATTRSGQGVSKPTGSLASSYGSFGSTTGSFDLSYGGKNWGNFFEVDALNTGRFLDPPEFQVFHAKGNEENTFDRVDYTFTPADSMHLDLNYSRSWFQTPNSYDNLNVQNVVSGGASPNPVFGNVGNSDQRSQIGTFNISPTYTHIVSNNSVFNLTTYARKDLYHYYPSNNPLADKGAPNLQTSSVAQDRTLFNVGGTANITYLRGHNNFKAGVEYDTTFLREHDSLGVVDPTYALSAPCVDANGNPLAGYSSPSQCAGALSPNPSYAPTLAPYDFTRGGNYYHYFGHADIKVTGLYIQDQLKAGNWTGNIGIRGDIYNGLASATQAEPRLGIAYNIKRTGTVLGASYARSLETPFNENLVLSSQGCSDPVLSPLLNCTPGVAGTLQPGYQNEFHLSVQQAVGKHLVASGEYIWKYTRNAFDFSVLGNTPITFPIDWHNAKIPGLAVHLDVPEWRGLSAYSVMSHVTARFFPPQVAGAGATPQTGGQPFRIDHDEKFNQNSHVQYTWEHGQFLKGLWGGFNWRYDSGEVAGAIPLAANNSTPVDLSGLTNDEQQEAGIVCGGVKATLAHGFTSCAPSQYSSTLISLPAPGTQNPDTNPARIAPRNLFDASLGKENLFHADRYKLDLDITAINVTNKYALYNFLSTFSGTHYVTPRAVTAKLTLHF